MTRPSTHRLLLAAALAVLAASGAWFAVAARQAGSARQLAAAKKPALSSAPYAPVGRDAPEVATDTWEPPPPQRRGKDWVYDVFTPPEIFYDERTKQFSIAPPVAEPPPVDTAPALAPYGLELVAVRREPFRLQLVGYVGDEKSGRGLFENVLTTETFLATAGRRLPALELTIEEFSVARRPVALADSMTTSRLVATAVVRDERTGRRFTLTNNERLYPEAATATVKTADAEASREVHEGDTVTAGDATFRIEKIQLAPPAVDVTKTSASQPPEPRTLTIAAPDAPAGPPSRN